MPQELTRPQSGTTPKYRQASTDGSPTERLVLHAWVLIIVLALLWVLLN
jgi:hypothetical protein